MYDRLKRTDRDQNEPILMFDILGWIANIVSATCGLLLHMSQVAWSVYVRHTDVLWKTAEPQWVGLGADLC